MALEQREYTPEELGLVPSSQPAPLEQREYTPEELGLTPSTSTATTPTAPLKQREYTPEELGISPDVSKKAEDVGFFDRLAQSFKEGISSFEDIKAGYDLALTEDNKDAAQQMANIKAQSAADELSRIPTLTARDIQRIAEEKGLISAGTQIPSYLLEQIAKSGPQMAVPILVSLGVGAISGPLAPITAPLAGIITYGAQQFGNFMNTQGLVKSAPEELDAGKALKWAAITAPVGFAMDRFTLGITSAPKKEIAKEVAEELAKRGVIKTVGAQATKGATKGFIVEAPTEVLETWAELHQAGADTSSEDAYEAYFEAFWAAGAVGGGLGGAAGAYRGYKDFKEAQLVSTQPVDSDEVDTNEKVTETRNQKINEILGEQKAEVRLQEAKEISKADIKVIDNDVLKKLGINPRSTPAKTLLDLDLTNPDNIEIAKNVLDKENLKIKTNEKAVDNFRRKLNKLEKKLAQEKVDADEPPKRPRPGARAKVSEQPNTDITTTTQKTNRDTMDVSRTGLGGLDDTKRRGSPPLKNLDFKYLNSQLEGLDSVLKEAIPLEEKIKKYKKPRVNDTYRFKQLQKQIKVYMPYLLEAAGETNVFAKSELGLLLGRLTANPYDLNNKRQELQSYLDTIVKEAAQPQTAKQRALNKKAKKESTAQTILDEQIDKEVNDIETELDPIKKAEKEAKLAGEFDADTIYDEVLDQEIDLGGKLPATRAGKRSQRPIIQDLQKDKTLGQVLTKLKGKFRDSLNDAQSILLDKLSILPNINKTKFQVQANMEQTRDDRRPSGQTDQYGLYTTTMDTVQVSDKADVETILHETTHAATANELRKHVRNGKGVTTLGRRIVQLFDTAKAADTDGRFETELSNVDEFVSEAFNNDNFQRFLASVPSPEATPQRPTTIWSDFVEAVKTMLGLGDISGTVLNDVIAIAPDLFKGPNLEEQQSAPPKLLPRRINRQREQELDDKLERTKTAREIEKEEEAKREPIEPNKSQVSISDKIATTVFSFDAALDNKIRAELKKVMKEGNITWDDVAKILNDISASQALHAEEVSQQFLQFGEIVYNEDLGKFEVVASREAPSFKKIMTSLKSIADNNGISLDKMRKIATKAFVALRAKNLQQKNTQLELQARQLVQQGKTAEARKLLQENYVLVDMTEDQINEALEFFEEFPELNDIHDMWIETKNNAINFLVFNEVMSQEQADEFMNVVDTEGEPDDTYVPFYREEGPEPVQYQRGLGDRGKFYKIKGSYEPVADVFENMDKWIRKSIKQGILNRAAINKIDATIALPNSESMIKEVATRGPNTVAISRVNPETGKQKLTYYEFSDPYYAAAIGGIETITIDGIKWLASASNLLRQNIVLYPLFSLAQLPQDSVSAMFSSGVKYPFMIPLRVMAQFPLTLLGLSRTHNRLKKVGAVGGFGSYLQGESQAERDIQKPGWFNKMRRSVAKIPGLSMTNPIKAGDLNLSVSGLLNRIAMASDNAVRQAVYDQTMMETGDARLAIERAFEIINFKRAGSNKYVTAARQYIPFFGAALQALSVQGRVLTAKGVAPQTRAQGIANFLRAWASLAGLTLLYNALMSDDEEFKKLDPSVRDRRLLFGNGYHITLRPDIFTYLGKIMPEHVIQNMVYESEDNQKFWDALKRNAADIISMNVLPQLLRPGAELFYNYSPVTGRPIVPQSLQDEPISQQYTASTTELGKLIGQLTNIPPPAVDYFFRQYFGYTGGLVMMFASSMIEDADIFKYDMPTKSERDLLASIPGMSAFISKEYGNRYTSDYYELKAEVDKAYKQFQSLDKYGFDIKKAKEYYQENKKLIDTKDDISTLQKDLTAIRQRRKEILQTPRTKMSADEKKAELDSLKNIENTTLGRILEIRKRVYGTRAFAED